MNKKFLYLLGILITIIIGTYFYWSLCCRTCNANNNGGNTIKLEEPIINHDLKVASYNPFSVKSTDGNLSLSTAENFNFQNSDLNFQQPIPPFLDEEIVKMKTYLTSREGKSVAITGYYKSNEINSSAFSNLGLARANTVKNYLVTKGIPSKFVNTKGELNESIVADSLNVFHGPVAFDILNFKENTIEIDSLRKELKKNPLVLYFKTGQKRIEFNSVQRKKISVISKYLDKSDGSFCVVIGHTDNVGDIKSNIVLGQERANFVKQYLVTNAILESRIKAISKGSNTPIADNATKEGQAKNRRIEITIE